MADSHDLTEFNSTSEENPEKPVNLTIYCEILGNWREMLEEIKDLTKIQPDAALTGSLIKIKTPTLGYFRDIQRYLVQKKSPFKPLTQKKRDLKNFFFVGSQPLPLSKKSMISLLKKVLPQLKLLT